MPDISDILILYGFVAFSNFVMNNNTDIELNNNDFVKMLTFTLFYENYMAVKIKQQIEQTNGE